MAEKRELGTEQIAACHRIMGLPNEEMAEITAKQDGKIRDYGMEIPLEGVKLVVIDEAHKATKEHVFAKVLRAIWERNKLHRVLALTAAPGRNMTNVSEVVQNLFISHIEPRDQYSRMCIKKLYKRSLRQ